MKRSYYLGIYLPILSIFFTFYAMVLIVIFLKRKDHILGSIFFSISFFLGIIELTVVVTTHFLQIMPGYGVFIDEIYLKLGGIFPVICNYVPITLGTLQYMIISICSLNRLFVLVGNTGTKKVKMDFYDKLTIFLCILVTIGTFLAYSPLTFATKSSYFDYRINKTYSDDLTIAVRCDIDSQFLISFKHLFLIISKSSNVIFALIVYSITFFMFWWNKKNQQFNNNDRIREVKLAGAVFIHTLIATAGTFVYVSLMYIWPQYLFQLLDFIYVIEDISRMLSPILLMIFSRPLRIAFMQIYWKKKNSKITSNNARAQNSTKTKVPKISPSIQTVRVCPK